MLNANAALETDCKEQPLLFQDLGARKVVADFSGGHLSVDGGVLLLRQLDAGLGITRKLAGAFGDGRDPELIEHSVPEMLRQRLFGLALGYEDLNDHQQLRLDPLLALGAGKIDPLGVERALERDRGKALAAPSTLNRLELGGVHGGGDSRYHKISHDPAKVEAALLEMGVRCLPREATEIVLDFDASDDPLHGKQEGRFFHGYYREYCYLPLYCFAGDVILWAQLRTSDRDASDGTVDALEKIVAAIRKRLPAVRIIVRGDSGFCREPVMAWCEGQKEVYYCLGLARNGRLVDLLQAALQRARERHVLSGGASAREFVEFEYQTLKSWSRARRVIGKAEVMAQGDNPRFVVTNLPAAGFAADAGHAAQRFHARELYEKFYCGRGEAENCIKQLHLDLEATRTSTHWLASNQLRLWFSAFGYLLLERLRALTLRGSDLARASLGTVRLRLLKVAAQVSVSVRRVYVRLNTSYPLAGLFRQCQRRLLALAETG
jgi:hypothetical protein